nr:uncharacterized protein LOC105484131 [Macaca nemestrina]
MPGLREGNLIQQYEGCFSALQTANMCPRSPEMIPMHGGSQETLVSDKQKQHLSQTLTENYGQLEPRRPHLSRPAATGGAQEPQMVTERRAGQHRCRTLPPSRKALLDGTVPDPDGSSAAQHVPAVVGGESRQCPPAAARRWWHSAASRPTPPTSARERLNPTVSLSPREHEGRCLRDNMNLSGTGLGGVWMWAQHLQGICPVLSLLATCWLPGAIHAGFSTSSVRREMLMLIQGSGGSVSCALRTIQGGGVHVCAHIDESILYASA